MPVFWYRNLAAGIRDSRWFGDGMALSAGRLVIAAPADDMPINNGGTVFVYGTP